MGRAGSDSYLGEFKEATSKYRRYGNGFPEVMGGAGVGSASTRSGAVAKPSMRSCGRKDCCSKKGTMVDATIMSGQGYTKNQKQCGGAKANAASRLLRSDHPTAMRDFVRMLAGQ
jgi:hypothetical protein